MGAPGGLNPFCVDLGSEPEFRGPANCVGSELRSRRDCGINRARPVGWAKFDKILLARLPGTPRARRPRRLSSALRLRCHGRRARAQFAHAGKRESGNFRVGDPSPAPGPPSLAPESPARQLPSRGAGVRALVARARDPQEGSWRVISSGSRGSVFGGSSKRPDPRHSRIRARLV